VKNTPLVIAFLLLLASCKNEPPPPDPQLLAAAERTVRPNTTDFVTDGELVSGIYFVVDSGYGYPRSFVLYAHPPVGAYYFTSTPTLYLDPSPIVTLGNFTRIRTDDAIQGGREVRLEMDEVGTARWLVATRLSISKQVAIVVRDSVVSAPIVQDQIPSGRAAINLVNVPESEVEAFAQQLNAEKAGVKPVR
jgi:hypothetical protein